MNCQNETSAWASSPTRAGTSTFAVGASSAAQSHCGPAGWGQALGHALLQSLPSCRTAHVPGQRDAGSQDSSPPQPRPTHTRHPLQPPTCCSGLETAAVGAARFRVHPSQHHAWHPMLLSHWIAPHPAATSSAPPHHRGGFPVGHTRKQQPPLPPRELGTGTALQEDKEPTAG